MESRNILRILTRLLGKRESRLDSLRAQLPNSAPK